MSTNGFMWMGGVTPGCTRARTLTGQTSEAQHGEEALSRVQCVGILARKGGAESE